jgi:hypothetical protein
MYDMTGIPKPYNSTATHGEARKNNIPRYRDDSPEGGADVTRGNKQALLLCKESTTMEDAPEVAELLEDYDRLRHSSPA